MFPIEKKNELLKTLTEAEIRALWRIDQRVELREYFFRTKTDIKWFEPSKVLGYFSVGAAPSPKEDEKGSFSIPQWEVLHYLKNVAGQLKDLSAEQQSRYRAELLAIISKVSLARQRALGADSESLVLDNYRTWYFFSQILNLLPNGDVPVDILNLLPTWFISRFEAILPGSEVTKTLLPKFLLGSHVDDIRKAELIADAVTRVRWRPIAADRQHFGEVEKAVLAVDDYWLLESFIMKKNAQLLGEKCSDAFLSLFGDRLHEALRRDKPHAFHIDTGDADTNKILRVTRPERQKLTCAIGSLEKEEIGYGVDWGMFHPVEMFDVPGDSPDLWQPKLVEEIRAKLSPAIADRNRDQLNEFAASLLEDLSYIWYQNIATQELNAADSAKETLTAILRDLLVGRARVDVDGTIRMLRLFSSASYGFPLFKRLAVYVIGTRWDAFSKLCWEFNDDWGNALFESPYFEAEMYQLLRENARYLSAEDRTKIKGIIATGPDFLKDDKDREKRLLLWQQKWYGSLKEDAEFAPLYEKSLQAVGVEVRPRFSEPRVRVGPGPSPLTVDQILKMSVAELAAFIPEFEKKGRQSWEDPTPEALSTAIKSAVTQNPDKFISELSPFMDLGYRYIYEVLFGILDAVRTKAYEPDWMKLSDFLANYISREAFWADKMPISASDHFGANHKWVVGMIGELVNQRSQSKSHIAGPMLSKIRALLDGCISNLSEKYDADSTRDPVSTSLNTAAGKSLEAIFEVALNVARENQSKGLEPLWDKDLKKDYEAALARPFLEAHEILGRHIANFWFLDSEWVKEKVGEYNTRSDDFWYAFLIGYLHSGAVYDQLFPLMETLYKRAIDLEFKDTRSAEALVQQIGVIYLRGYPGQGLEDAESLVNRLIRTGKVALIDDLVGYLWMQRPDSPRVVAKSVVAKVVDGEVKPVVVGEDVPPSKDEGPPPMDHGKKILIVWRALAGIYSRKTPKTDAEKALLAELAKLTVFIPELNDENVGWIKSSADQPGRGFGYAFVIEYLDRLKAVGDPARNSTYIVDIFLTMLRGSTPDFQEKHIKSLFDFVFSHGNAVTRGKAGDICNTYAERGRPDLLRSVYEKYLKRQV